MYFGLQIIYIGTYSRGGYTELSNLHKIWKNGENYEQNRGKIGTST